MNRKRYRYVWDYIPIDFPLGIRLMVLVLMGVTDAPAQYTPVVRFFITYGLITDYGLSIPVTQVRMYDGYTDTMSAYKFLASQPDKFHTISVYGSGPLEQCANGGFSHSAHGKYYPCIETVWGAFGVSDSTSEHKRARRLPEPRPALEGQDTPNE